MINVYNRNVLLLNGYQPHDIISWQKAMTLWSKKRINLVEFFFDNTVIHTIHKEYKMPSVVNLLEYKNIPNRDRISLNKTNVLVRDDYTCGYCGRHLTDSTGTRDHVIPISRGGEDKWTNIVSSCKDCNSSKRNRTPKEAKMSLKIKPQYPKKDIFFGKYLRRDDYKQWRTYFSGWLKRNPSYAI